MELEIIAFFMEHSRETLEPYEAFGEGPEKSYYHCRGCNGEFLSRWPEWKEPTVETFPHDADCKIPKYKQFIEEKMRRRK